MTTRPWVGALAASVASVMSCSKVEAAPGPDSGTTEIVLPAPRTTGPVALESALSKRRSIRDVAPGPLRIDELAQLLWATQGITEPKQGLRVAPSAGAIYPLELYLARADGVFRYIPARHVLLRVRATDARPAIAQAALGQEVVQKAPVLFLVTGVLARTRVKYGARAERYVALEAGHAVQGLLLEATALGLAATPIGAFDDDAMRAAVGVADAELPLYVVTVGRPAT